MKSRAWKKHKPNKTEENWTRKKVLIVSLIKTSGLLYFWVVNVYSNLKIQK